MRVDKQGFAHLDALAAAKETSVFAADVWEACNLSMHVKDNKLPTVKLLELLCVAETAGPVWAQLVIRLAMAIETSMLSDFVKRKSTIGADEGNLLRLNPESKWPTIKPR